MTGKSFLENKCGYSQCCNLVDEGSENYLNLGGFIFVTKICDQHKESTVKFLLAVNRTVFRDSICLDIIKELDSSVRESVVAMIKAADEMLPYPQQQSFSDNPPIDKASVYVPDKNEPKTRPLNKKKEESKQ